MSIAKQAARRRTYAIISHPDAGKTTLTEKLLLYSGAIHLAGSVRARKTTRHTVSDWMKMEQERRIELIHQKRIQRMQERHHHHHRRNRGQAAGAGEEAQAWAGRPARGSV